MVDRQPSEPAFNTRKKAAHSCLEKRMKLKTANIDIRVEPALVEKIDAWRARQRVLPSRAAAIVYMIEEFLEHDSMTPGDTGRSRASGAVADSSIRLQWRT
jgi:hypothetical protein